MSIIYTFMYFSCKPKEMSIQTQIYIVNALLTGTLDLRRLQPRIPEESSPPWLLLPCNPPACLWRNGSRQMEWKMSDPGKESEMEATTYVIGWDLPDWFDAQQFAPNGTPVSDPKGTKPCARQVRRQQLLSWSSIPESTMTSSAAPRPHLDVWRRRWWSRALVVLLLQLLLLSVGLHVHPVQIWK